MAKLKWVLLSLALVAVFALSGLGTSNLHEVAAEPTQDPDQVYVVFEVELLGVVPPGSTVSQAYFPGRFVFPTFGDLNGDGIVDTFDLVHVAKSFGMKSAGSYHFGD